MRVNGENQFNQGYQWLVWRWNRVRQFAIASSVARCAIASVAPLAPVLLGGYLAMMPQTPAEAESVSEDFLIAQVVYEEPPPPPEDTYIEDRDDEDDGYTRRRYVVYVNGDSPLLLDMVQEIVPDAFVRRYKNRNVIQAAVFNYRDQAQDFARRLEEQYIDTEIATITSRWDRDGYLDRNSNSQSDEDRYYFVIVPASEEDLPFVTETVKQLVPELACGSCLRDYPRGSQVAAVGPFSDRRTAQRWQRYLRDFGLWNARLYYGR